MGLLNQQGNASTYENLVANDVLQLELPRYVFKRDVVARLEEPCRQETHPDMQDFQNKRWDLGAMVTVQVNLQQVFLDLFVLQQISEHTLQQLQT